jgi:hypothetical protein
MASQESESSQLSHTTCATLPESEILTESELDELADIPTTSLETTRDQRVAIKTALRFKVPWSQIRKELNVTNRQIQYANRHRLTHQKNKAGTKPKLSTPRKRALEAWLLESPSRRHIPWKQIPLYAPQFSDVGEDAIYTAMRALGYQRRVAQRKGFSTDPEVMRERLDFARQAVYWTRERLYAQIFSDEVWAKGGAHTVSFVTVKEDGSDRYLPENLQRKEYKYNYPFWDIHPANIKSWRPSWQADWDRRVQAKSFRDHCT